MKLAPVNESTSAALQNMTGPTRMKRSARKTRKSGSIRRTILGRLAGGLLVLWGGATLTFLVLHLLPGDPVDILLGNDPNASPAVRQQITEQYGLDRSVLFQYVDMIGRLVRLDLGQSYQLQQPVAAVLGSELMPTVYLALSSAALAVIGGILIAALTAGRSRIWRSVSSFLELVAISMPAFWVGLLLLAAFSFNLRIFPLSGGDGISSLVLPTITLSLGLLGTLAQVIRGGMEVTLEQPFIVTAQARGVSHPAVVYRHALKHSMLSVITLTGQFMGQLLGGAIIVEIVFGRPGIGRLTLQAVNGKDIPVITGIVLLAGVVYVIANALADVLYTVVDPRLRTSAEQ